MNTVVSNMQRDFKYRKDIDGLRAISILLVVFYHLKCRFAPSGFLGVDVFFIISGFLITSHLISENQAGCFSFKKFYLKRIRRIIPALGLVLMVTTIAAYFLFYQTDLRLFIHSLIASLLFSSNFYFWRYNHFDVYFSTYSQTMPLLHTWSLAIEEQFYIFWPIFIYFICKYKMIKQLNWMAILICLFSFSGYLFFKTHVNFVYFSPVTRAFELLLGALLAINDTRINFLISKRVSDAISLIALAMIIGPAVFLSHADFPGVFIVFPCVGVVLIIALGSIANPIGNKIISNSIFVFIGLISYSLYLWHWPIIAFANYFNVVLNFKNATIIFLASILLSTLTWLLIEKPFRYQFKLNFKKTILCLLILFWVPEATFSLVLDHRPSLGFNSVSENTMKAMSFYGLLKKKYGCFNESNTLHFPSEKLCAIGSTAQKNPNVLVTGDSHAFADIGMLDVLLKNADLKGYIFTQWQLGYNQDQHEYWNMVTQLIQQKRYHYLIFARWWNTYVNNVNTKKPNYSKIENQLNRMLKLCEKYKVTPVIIFDFPALRTVPKTCGFSRITEKHCYNSVRSIEQKDKAVSLILMSLKKKYPTVIFIDPKKIICDKQHCYSSINGVPLYANGRDNSHLSFIGSTLVGELYLKKYGNPFGMQVK